MIVQACMNGARPPGFHPALPLTTEAMVRDAAACVTAGANELHIHPRGTDGRESLGAVDSLMCALGSACSGTLVGVSTGCWIEGDETGTRKGISDWSVLPDYASVNLSEADAPAVIALLCQKGVGVEAGLASVEDARRFITIPERDRVLRILIEIEEQQLQRAMAIADGIAAVLHNAGVTRPILLQGFDATVWAFVRLARERLWSTRVGLEDGNLLEDGSVAPSNAKLVSDAVAIYRQAGFSSAQLERG